MDTLIILKEIGIIMIAAILVVILLFLIPVLLQVRRTAREAEKLIDSVRLQVAPISRDIGFISRDIKNIVQSIHRQVDRVEDGVEIVNDMVVRARELQIEVQQKIEQPLLHLAAVLGGIKHGIESVVRVFCR